jgi:hypothetical protein
MRIPILVLAIRKLTSIGFGHLAQIADTLTED